MADDLLVACYPVFVALPAEISDHEREVAAKEAQNLLDAYSERVETRGVYSTAGFRAGADFMMWWIAKTVDDIQGLYTAFRRTTLGRALQPIDLFLGISLPAEFSPEHLPAFAENKSPKKYITVYPFVRTPEWYLLDPRVRGEMLKQHGDAGREYPDVQANTTSAFGLGDFEWILAFEADSPDRLVQLIRRLRATEARLYTKVETPFYPGIRKTLAEVVAELPF